MIVVTVAGRPVPLDPRLAWHAIRADIVAMPRVLKAWLLLLLLLATAYVFWILPMQLGPRQVHVEFSGDK